MRTSHKHASQDLSAKLRQLEEQVAELRASEKLLREAQKKLRANEERYARAVRSGKVGVWDWDITTGEIYLDPILKQILGYEDPEIANHMDDWSTHVHPDDAALVQKKVEEHFSGMTSHFEVEHRMLHKDGSIRWFLARGTVEKSPDGTPQRMLGTDTDITKRKEIERQLKASEERLKILFEFTPDAYLMCDFDGVLLEGNQAIKKLTGFDKQGLIGKSLFDMSLLAPEDHLRAKVFLRTNKQGHAAGPEEFLLHSKDDRSVSVEVATYPVTVEGQKLVMGIIRDITERKKTQKALEKINEELEKRVEERTEKLQEVNRSLRKEIAERKRVEKEVRKLQRFYEKILDNLPVQMGVFDVEGHYLYVNPAGIQNDDLRQWIIGKTDLDWIRNRNDSDSIATRRMEAQKRCIQEKRIITFEEQLKGADSQTRHILRHYSPITDSQGEVTNVIGYALDITANRKAERALRENEAKYRNLFNHSIDGIILHDVRGRICEVNQTALQLFGFTRQAFLEKKIYDLLSPEAVTFATTEFEKVDQYTHVDFEIQFVKANAETFLGEVSVTLFSLGGEQLVQTIVRDITQRRQMEKELARAQRMEAAGQVAGQIAHDFNNLLSPLAAYPTLIREDLPPGHTSRKLLDEIEFGANRIAEINQQLLALGRRGHYSTEAIDLNELLQKVVKTQNLPDRINVRYGFATDLLLIEGGVAQLSRVLVNLIGNAVDAMPGTGTLTLRTENVYLEKPVQGYETVQSGEYVRLEISDTGCGIPADMMDKIFDPFFTTKKMDKVRGSGLGLSVVESIVRDHNGYITIASVEGKGSTFSVYLPVARQIELSKVVESVKGGNETILVVDDDPMQRRVASKLLARLGYQVQSVDSGEAAVDYLKENPHDLILLDMVMGGIDGTETYRRILENYPDQKAIILSGYAVSNRVKEALELGVGAFAVKPISLSSVAKAVRSELDK